MSKVFISTSGYNYSHWGGGVFYPEGLPESKWLEYYIKYFKTVELNVSFYRLPTSEAFKSWYKRTPKNFAFAIKGSRFITHIKRLKDCQEPLKLFFSRAGLLKEKLHVVLWQLPPKFKINIERLEEFIDLLNKIGSKYRHCFEFRHQSWFCQEVLAILEKNDMAFCLADYPDYKIEHQKFTSFIYIRRHGTGGLYSSCYSDKELSQDAEKIKRWLKENKDVYIYFNNDTFGYAVKNALTLKKMVKEVD